MKNPLVKPTLSITEGVSAIEGSTIERFQCTIFNCDVIIREIALMCLCLHFESYGVINLLLELPWRKTVVLNYTYHRHERSTTNHNMCVTRKVNHERVAIWFFTFLPPFTLALGLKFLNQFFSRQSSTHLGVIYSPSKAPSGMLLAPDPKFLGTTSKPPLSLLRLLPSWRLSGRPIPPLSRSRLGLGQDRAMWPNSWHL